MITKFSGPRGPQMLVEELQRQKLTAGILGLPKALAERGKLTEIKKGESVIEQGGKDTDIYFIISGSFGIFVNKKRIASRFPGDHIGEMAAISPIQSRSASVIADENSLVLKITAESLYKIADKFPDIWKHLARELARRLEQRNALVRVPNEKVRVFVISSAEALPVARSIENAFAHDPFLTIVWSEGVFKVSNYTLESLENQLEQCDFAVAVAHPDDQTTIRGTSWPSARDNVIFELGFFMGRLGRQRAILMEPRNSGVKLPSDLAGVTTISYRFEPGDDAASLIGPACNQLRDHILKLGRNI